MLAQIYDTEGKKHTIIAVKLFGANYGAKYLNTIAKINDDLDAPLEFFNYPAEYWMYLRATNPIEPTFAIVQLNTHVAKGPDSRATGIAIVYKQIESAERCWRTVTALHLVARQGRRHI